MTLIVSFLIMFILLFTLSVRIFILYKRSFTLSIRLYRSLHEVLSLAAQEEFFSVIEVPHST